jgi:hypothetical protein
LGVGEVSFEPGDDEVESSLVVERVALPPFMRIHWFAGGVADDEMRIAVHAVDPAAAEQG